MPNRITKFRALFIYVKGDPTGLEKSLLNQFCYWAQVSIIKCSQKVELTVASIFYTGWPNRFGVRWMMNIASKASKLEGELA